MQGDQTNIRIFLSLGTNLGDRQANLKEAIERIKDLGLDVVRASSIYETEPVGYRNQGWFLNQVIEVRIRRPRELHISNGDKRFFKELMKEPDNPGAQAQVAEALLGALLKIEEQMGRQRPFKNAPRVMDIDILLFGDCTIHQTGGKNQARTDLFIPHPRMCERRFVLEPLCEIAPDLIDPVSQTSFTSLLAALKNEALVKRLYENS